jgi:hypothetical protein
MLAGETKWFITAHCVLKLVRSLPAEKKAEYESQGIGCAFRSIEMHIGTTLRNRRTKKTKHNKTLEELQTDSIRVQISGFINDHSDLKAFLSDTSGRFGPSFGAMKRGLPRMEVSYLARVEAFEQIDAVVGGGAVLPRARQVRFRAAVLSQGDSRRSLRRDARKSAGFRACLAARWSEALQ